MFISTRKQREALFRVFQRSFPNWVSPTQRVDGPRGYERTVKVPSTQYRRFLKTVQSAFGDCLMVPYAGMWLGIEKDGYTHS